ncbi:hypothetical protein HN371_14175 [Candidatus Poribacteria bacterium]|nr:hypothetical protein [Candidatus Poribacteria bacterium]MBT5534923.1 hypothetical protein [Candidatus Poribacteria bacterium]MBT7101202.1 hypothetical protein [Candidatus Poribacteria bacterium]MBT7806131.1 hypothetical protein [Candidatus Poribacteria bacterium]
MWNVIADLVKSYAADGDADLAMATLAEALAAEPMWIPNALVDERTAPLRDRPDFAALTALPDGDGPAHFNAAAVALEHGQVGPAVTFMRRAFEIAATDGSVSYLVEAVQNDDAFRPYLAHSELSGLMDTYA